MLKSMLRFLSLAVLFGLVTAHAAAQSEDIVPYDNHDNHDNQLDPVALLTSYYNAINQRDYARAYGYWELAPDSQTLAQFEADFAHIERVEVVAGLPVIVEGAAGSLYASIRAMLFVESDDEGTPPHYIAGFTARQSRVARENASAPDPAWYLYRANIDSVSITSLDLTNQVCQPGPGFAESQLTPEFLISAYYNAIQDGAYARAYGYWSTPPNGQTLEDFAAGFAEVDEIKVFVRLASLREAAAGTRYARVPVLLDVTQKTGNLQRFVGCFVTKRAHVPVGNETAPDPNWYIHDANLQQAMTPDSGLNTLLTACAPE